MSYAGRPPAGRARDVARYRSSHLLSWYSGDLGGGQSELTGAGSSRFGVLVRGWPEACVLSQYGGVAPADGLMFAPSGGNDEERSQAMGPRRGPNPGRRKHARHGGPDRG